MFYISVNLITSLNVLFGHSMRKQDSMSKTTQVFLKQVKARQTAVCLKPVRLIHEILRRTQSGVVTTVICTSLSAAQAAHGEDLGNEHVSGKNTGAVTHPGGDRSATKMVAEADASAIQRSKAAQRDTDPELNGWIKDLAPPSDQPITSQVVVLPNAK